MSDQLVPHERTLMVLISAFYSGQLNNNEAHPKWMSLVVISVDRMILQMSG